ncbi:hypothetical protein OG21DRAFT_824809 [Imleria badia]|nr:hypothetical protein OG21DRAFT_824809 [Imleria badia]
MTPVSYVHEDQCCAACNGSQDLSLIGPHKERAACRYYQSGNCRRGSGCPFPHISIAAQPESPTTSHPAYPSEHMYTYYPLGQTPVYRPLGCQAQPLFRTSPIFPMTKVTRPLLNRRLRLRAWTIASAWPSILHGWKG